LKSFFFGAWQRRPIHNVVAPPADFKFPISNPGPRLDPNGFTDPA